MQLAGASNGAVTPPAGFTCQAADINYVCNATCGTSNEAAANWICSCSDGVTRTEAYCTPPTGPSCSNFSGCTYNATYGACNAACGQPGTEPVLTCTRSDGTPAALGNCSPQACTGAACPPPGTWTPTTSACSSTCGTGTTTTTYTCTGGTCSTPQPASTTASCEGTSTCQWTPTDGACQCSTSSTGEAKRLPIPVRRLMA